MNEKELLDHLAATSVPNLERMEYGFSHWDCTAHQEFAFGRVDFILELKCRETHYPEMLIEQAKYDWLIAEARKRKARPAYINSTPKGIFAWDLYRVQEPAWGEELMPATTHFEDTERIVKMVGFLPIADAVVLP
ncbi:hypothetical protein UFOVP394_31 [uncultured Caudovirales phage]|jgi:hypothetical protein|uniref:Uncharacterized protein n=1 Tax=uncultured Caudovirales phage TaxID=2100421 RepID=A0A6J7X1T3_9CAUD|nr:hypothetical protein UFOVP394_31 [uncultured Caudovirales phage]